MISKGLWYLGVVKPIVAYNLLGAIICYIFYGWRKNCFKTYAICKYLIGMNIAVVQNSIQVAPFLDITIWEVGLKQWSVKIDFISFNN
jgi:hypothetical protein